MSKPLTSGDRALAYVMRYHLAGAQEQLRAQSQAGRATSAIAERVRILQGKVDAFSAREAAERAELCSGIFD